jgi:hypothetical protein
MGDVIFQNGIAYGKGSGARILDMQYINMAAAKNSEPARPIQQVKPFDWGVLPWSPWGTNNLLAKEMVYDIKTCGILNSVIEGKARFAVCQGILPAIIKTDNTGARHIDKVLDGTEVNDFLEANNSFLNTVGWIKDYVGFNRMMARIMLNRKGDLLTLIQRDDISETRLSKKDSRSRINHVWHSAQWEKVRGVEDPYLFKIPLLNPSNPSLDLQTRIDGGDSNREFNIMITHPGWDEQYYPMPLWYAALKWVKIAQGIPEMKAVLFENNLRVKQVVIIYESFWTEAFGDEWENYTDEDKEQKRKKVYKDIDDFLVGSKNAYKTVFTTGYRDTEGRTYANIEFKPIDDTTQQGELLPDSAAANSEIAIAMLWNNAMTGGNQKAGQYSGNEGGSNVREASLMQTIIHEVERQGIRSILNVPKFFNGWNKKYQGLISSSQQQYSLH